MKSKFTALIAIMCLLLFSCSQNKQTSSAFSSRTFAVKPIRPVNKKYRGADENYRGYQRPEQLTGFNNQAGYIGEEENTVDIRAYNADGAPVANLSAISFKSNDGNLYPVKEMIYGGLNQALEDIHEYRFGKNDQMSLYVEGHEEFSGKLQVLSDGTVELPLLKKRIPALNLNRNQLKEAVKRELRQYVRAEPEVQLGIDFAAGQYYYMFGEVNSPGRYPMGVSPITVSEAIFRSNSAAGSTNQRNAGGVTINNREQVGIEERIKAELDTSPRYFFNIPRTSDLSKVYVITPHRSRPIREIVNVKEILIQGITGADKVIKPGQIIFVPSAIDERFSRFVERITRPISRARDVDEEVTDVYERLYGLD
ncbi:MAG: polysaccharide biosynthesis/export family protein [Planctomycetota bacterium]|jgi:protein involved in polysaccharide export with SLBB domain